ncbi:hypothetical protein PR048_019866 [Dryococelus australis]|uniref:Integrase catalytic domain-containing protein n=1 Tax=Dryococelus australis TaxID=614101 RepID=A0ABQ9H4M7_9NEOP|nr:hypothetical protein PR048_019866 [Dryococelus australis]
MQGMPICETTSEFQGRGLFCQFGIKTVGEIFLDIYGPLPRSKGSNNCIFILVDSLSKFSLFLPLRDIKARNIVQALVTKAWKIFGSPNQIVTANRNYFHSRLIKDMYFQWGLDHVNTNCVNVSNAKRGEESNKSSYPNLLEHFNKNVKVTLHIFHHANQRTWDGNLRKLNLGFNSVTHSSMGFSLSKVFLGHELSLPLLNILGIPSESMDKFSGGQLEDLFGKVHENLEKAQKGIEWKFNSDRVANPYNVGDLVVCRHYSHSRKAEHFPSKLSMPFDGPCKILKILGPVTFLLGDPPNDFETILYPLSYCCPTIGFSSHWATAAPISGALPTALLQPHYWVPYPLSYCGSWEGINEVPLLPLEKGRPVVGIVVVGRLPSTNVIHVGFRLVYLEAANRCAAEKRSSSKRLMRIVHFERETPAIGTHSKVM